MHMPTSARVSHCTPPSAYALSSPPPRFLASIMHTNTCTCPNLWPHTAHRQTGWHGNSRGIARVTPAQLRRLQLIVRCRAKCAYHANVPQKGMRMNPHCHTIGWNGSSAVRHTVHCSLSVRLCRRFRKNKEKVHFWSSLMHTVHGVQIATCR